MSNTLENIRKFLIENDVTFREVHHQATYTSEQSAEARGESIKIGGKALLIKIESTFKLFVMSAENKLHSKALKTYFGSKKIRFANEKELFELTGLVPGSVPPFGAPILELDLYIDDSIFENQRIAFNAGSLTDSIIISVDDYIRITPHKRFSFSSK